MSWAGLLSSCPRPGRCRRDFSSHRPQPPALTDIGVLRRLLTRAARNSGRRLAERRAGRLTPADQAEGRRRLEDWLCATLAGENPAFATAEDWNPRGLAAFLRGPEGTAPADDRAVIADAVARLVAELAALEEEWEPSPDWSDADARREPSCLRFVAAWSARLAGLPEPDGGA